MAHDADLSFPLPDPDSARAVAEALRPEVADGPEGSTTVLAVEGAVVRARVTADSVGGLRAALNSVVRLLDAAVRTL